ncbi:MAG: hypothetical protein ACYDCO_25810 [Armatimonadota bacterium]
MGRLSRALLLSMFLLVVLLAWGILARAADANPFIELLPALKTLPAPPGAVEGLRLMYYSAAASVPGVHHSYKLDPDGNWVDEKGNRYTQHDEPSESGHGYTQVDVVALGAREAVLNVTSWGLQPNGMVQAVIPISGASCVSDTPAAGGDYWLHPKALAKAPALSGRGVTIVNMPYNIGETTFQAVRFQYEKPDSRTVYVFDRETGVLLHSNSMVKNRIRTMLTQNTLVNLRQVHWPWAKAARPDWLAALHGLQGSGNLYVSIPGTPSMPMPMQATMEVLARGDRWVRYRQSAGTAVPGMPSAPEVRVLASGPAQLGGLFLPPAGLAGLKDGQVLDEDPTTGTTTRVVSTGMPVDGRTAVVITEQGGAHSMSYAYDKATGMLVHFLQDDLLMNTRLDVAFRR